MVLRLLWLVTVAVCINLLRFVDWGTWGVALGLLLWVTGLVQLFYIWTGWLKARDENAFGLAQLKHTAREVKEQEVGLTYTPISTGEGFRVRDY